MLHEKVLTDFVPRFDKLLVCMRFAHHTLYEFCPSQSGSEAGFFVTLKNVPLGSQHCLTNLQDDSARQHALAKYSSKKLRTGLTQDSAAKGPGTDLEQGNGPSPEGPLTTNLPVENRALAHRDKEEHESNLDSSMGIGPVSHRSLASHGSGLGSEAAVASRKAFSAKSFGSSGGAKSVQSLVENIIILGLLACIIPVQCTESWPHTTGRKDDVLAVYVVACCLGGLQI